MLFKRNRRLNSENNSKNVSEETLESNHVSENEVPTILDDGNQIPSYIKIKSSLLMLNHVLKGLLCSVDNFKINSLFKKCSVVYKILYQCLIVFMNMSRQILFYDDYNNQNDIRKMEIEGIQSQQYLVLTKNDSKQLCYSATPIQRNRWPGRLKNFTESRKTNTIRIKSFVRREEGHDNTSSDKLVQQLPEINLVHAQQFLKSLIQQIFESKISSIRFNKIQQCFSISCKTRIQPTLHKICTLFPLISIFRRKFLIHIIFRYVNEIWNKLNFLNMKYMFCDLSTNSWKFIKLMIKMDFSKCGIDYSHISTSKLTKNFNTLKLFCDFLLILLNIKYCKYEFSVTDNLKYKNYDPLPAHNQPKNYISLDRIRNYYNLWIKWMFRRVKNLVLESRFAVRIKRQSIQRVNKNIKSNDLVNAVVFLIILCFPIITASSVHNIKYSTNIVKTKYGPLRGILVRTNPTIEAYLGVPYATPPVGSLRYMPPVTPSTWKNTKLADHFAPVCPQAPPIATSGMDALLEIPRGRLAQLRRLTPLLTNQSEDCLYLNLYVPRKDDTSTTVEKPLATLVYIHGESYEWNSGNPYDGSVLAAHGNIIVVTINFRLGVLGFLKTGTKGSAQGNFGLMDLVAGLHWLHENLPAFNGDPNKVTLMGHNTGAALANILIVSPVASDLIHRAILLSGSALSPWAIQRDPLTVKKRVAEHTGCHGDLLEDDLAPCLRTKPLAELLSIKLDSPRFLPGFAPFVDGTVLVNPATTPISPLTLPSGSAVASTIGLELANFPTRELMFGLTSIESYLDLSAQDLEFGFNETRRDRILRTYVRNVYHFHLNEIFSALKNEYTDWERSPRNMLGSRDAAMELLSDGHTVAPLIRLGYLHSLRGGRSYFMHFKHQSGERDFPQRIGTVRGEDVPFCLGLPVSPLFPFNYTQEDVKISRIMIHYLVNFIQTGNPNGLNPKPAALASTSTSKSLKTLEALHSSNAESLPSPSQLASMNTLPNNINIAQYKQSYQTGSSDTRKKRFLIETQAGRRHRKRDTEEKEEHINSDEDLDDDDEEENEAIAEESEDEDKEEYVERSHDRLDEDTDENNAKPIKMNTPFWDSYDSINQLYLELNNKPEIKNHYRGHKLSMWLSLIPQIHSPGDSPDLSMRHHHFAEESAQFYDGTVRTQSMQRPPVIKKILPMTTATPTHKTETTPAPIMPSLTTECPPNTTIVPTIAATRPQQNQDNNSISLLRRLTTNHYQSYATALTVTIAVGCFLLLLNVFIFAAIYYQREKRASYTKKKEELTEAENMNSSPSSIERYQQKGSRKSSLQSVSGNGFGEYSCYEEKIRCKEKRALVDLCTVELPLQEYKCSPPCSSTSGSVRRSNTPENFKHNLIDPSSQDNLILLPPSYLSQASTINESKFDSPSNNLVTYRSIIIPKEQCNQATQSDSPPTTQDVSTTIAEDDRELSPSIPEPPPPPRASFQGGILRQGNGPTTPGTSKKRVQIQEISV